MSSMRMIELLQNAVVDVETRVAIAKALDIVEGRTCTAARLYAIYPRHSGETFYKALLIKYNRLFKTEGSHG